MLKVLPLPYKLAAIAFVVAAAFGYGFYIGEKKAEAKFEIAKQNLQEELFDLAEDLSLKNEENLKLLAEREVLINEHETEAVKAPGSSNPGVAATGGLQRLDTRWGRQTE